ncbi:MAG: hypothetical protein OXG49_04140 [Chloroflexi bacterium]|nr:hypothetical protein [Chloroflexota bacterium]
MSEENQSENQSQASSENQTGANIENTPPKLQAVEPQPKPEPSFGIIDEGSFWPPFKRSQKAINQ